MEAIVYLLVAAGKGSAGGQGVDIPLAFAIAVAGGSIGTLLTLLSSVPEQIRHHDRQIGDVDGDLAQWVADEMVRLERAAKGHQATTAAAGQLYAGSYLTGLAHLKEQALHAYRDQEVGAERKRSAIRDSEGWRHAVVRLARQRPLPELQTPSVASPLLDLWRGEVKRHEDSAPVSDPTKRSLDWALSKYATDEHRACSWPPP